jgi:hypothetical protein
MWALLRSGRGWRYLGRTHETPLRDAGARVEPCAFLTYAKSGTKTPAKLERDRRLLELELREKPHDARTVFYLAQTYKDEGDHMRAFALYSRRALMGGWPEEVFMSLFWRAGCAEWLRFPWPSVRSLYEQAAVFDPRRAEPWCEIARREIGEGNTRAARIAAERASSLEPPKGALFVDVSAYGERPRALLAKLPKENAASASAGFGEEA